MLSGKSMGESGKHEVAQKEKPRFEARLMNHMDHTEQLEAGGLSNALRKRQWFNLPGSQANVFEEESFQGEKGAMFKVEVDGGIAGFLALTKDREKNTAMIKIVRADMRDPEIVRALIQAATLHAKDQGIGTLSVKISEDMRGIAHVFHELGFHEEGQEGERDILVAHM